MQHSEGIKKFKVYISYDFADSDKAEELQEFFLRKGILIQCDRTHYDTPKDQRVKLWAVKAIRSCDVFILLISHNSGSPKDWLKEMLSYEYAEAINFKRKIIYLCLDDPKKISSLTSEKLSKRPRHTFLILPEKDNNTINYQALLPVLKDCGCMIVDEDKTLHSEVQLYDVFICYKSADYEYARIVNDILESRGLKVFFSRESLPKLGRAEYHKQIDIAIERSTHMVVVASSRAHIESKWVEHEWLLFYDEKLDGRKEGNLVTVLAGDLSPSDLPISLRNLEAIPLVRGEIERLLEYVRKETVESVGKEIEALKSDIQEPIIDINESEFSIFFKGGKTFKIGVQDLLSAKVDAIVNPIHSSFISRPWRLSWLILKKAGPALEKECEKIIKKLGKIPVTSVVHTKAGDLPYKGIIHAVAPIMGDGEEQAKLEKTLYNCLLEASNKGWQSIAFPTIGELVPKKTCAGAFKNAVPLFWKEYKDTSVNLVWLCLLKNDFSTFKDVLIRDRLKSVPYMGRF